MNRIFFPILFFIIITGCNKDEIFETNMNENYDVAEDKKLKESAISNTEDFPIVRFNKTSESKSDYIVVVKDKFSKNPKNNGYSNHAWGVAIDIYYHTPLPKPGNGLPTGQRMHKPFVLTKEMDKSSPVFRSQAVAFFENLEKRIVDVVVTYFSGDVLVNQVVYSLYVDENGKTELQKPEIKSSELEYFENSGVSRLNFLIANDPAKEITQAAIILEDNTRLTGTTRYFEKAAYVEIWVDNSSLKLQNNDGKDETFAVKGEISLLNNNSEIVYSSLFHARAKYHNQRVKFHSAHIKQSSTNPKLFDVLCIMDTKKNVDDKISSVKISSAYFGISSYSISTRTTIQKAKEEWDNIIDEHISEIMENPLAMGSLDGHHNPLSDLRVGESGWITLTAYNDKGKQIGLSDELYVTILPAMQKAEFLMKEVSLTCTNNGKAWDLNAFYEVKETNVEKIVISFSEPFESTDIINEPVTLSLIKVDENGIHNSGSTLYQLKGTPLDGKDYQAKYEVYYHNSVGYSSGNCYVTAHVCHF